MLADAALLIAFRICAVINSLMDSINSCMRTHMAHKLGSLYR